MIAFSVLVFLLSLLTRGNEKRHTALFFFTEITSWESYNTVIWPDLELPQVHPGQPLYDGKFIGGYFLLYGQQ